MGTVQNMTISSKAETRGVQKIINLPALCQLLVKLEALLGLGPGAPSGPAQCLHAIGIRLTPLNMTSYRHK